MNEFERYLSSAEDTGTVSPQELKGFGVRAAKAYVTEEKPLNESIAEVVKTAKLNTEQTKRVVEHANNETFSHLFKAGHDKNITFPMADVSAVAQMSNKGPMNKTASRLVLTTGRYVAGQESVDFDSLFLADPMEKVASAELSETDKRKAAFRFSDLRNEYEDLSSEVDKLADVFASKLSNLKHHCKLASAEGYSASTIALAIEKASPSQGLRDVIEIDFGDDLVLFGHNEKLAMHGMAIQHGNPITGLTQDLEGVSGKLVTAQQSMQRVQMSMTDLLNVLRGPDPGAGLANHVFNPGGMGSQPAPPPGVAPAQANPPTHSPQGTESSGPAGGSASSSLSGLFGRK